MSLPDGTTRLSDCGADVTKHIPSELRYRATDFPNEFRHLSPSHAVSGSPYRFKFPARFRQSPRRWLEQSLALRLRSAIPDRLSATHAPVDSVPDSCPIPSSYRGHFCQDALKTTSSPPGTASVWVSCANFRMVPQLSLLTMLLLDPASSDIDTSMI